MKSNTCNIVQNINDDNDQTIAVLSINKAKDKLKMKVEWKGGKKKKKFRFCGFFVYSTQSINNGLF